MFSHHPQIINDFKKSKSLADTASAMKKFSQQMYTELYQEMYLHELYKQMYEQKYERRPKNVSYEDLSREFVYSVEKKDEPYNFTNSALKKILQDQGCDIGTDNVLEMLNKKLIKLLEQINNEQELILFIYKLHMVYLYFIGINSQLFDEMGSQTKLLENTKDENKKILLTKKISALESKQNSLNEIISVVIALKAEAINHLYNDTQEQYAFMDMLEQHGSAFESYAKRDKISLMELKKTPTFIDPEKFPFEYNHYALQRYLATVNNKSGLMKYIHGENKNGHVKTKQGKRISCLDKELDDIYHAEYLSTSQKMEALEQAVLDMYLQVRTDQGWRDSKLGNVLENYIKNYLHLEEKYDIRISHESAKQKFKLKEVTNFNKEFKKLGTRIDPRSRKLKTKKEPMIEDLRKELHDIGLNLEKTEPEKIHLLQIAVCETWDKAQKHSKQHKWWNQCNLADELKDYMKKEFGKDVKEMQELLTKENLMELQNVVKH